ncbi:hypothetical protein FQA39_LY02756 [Lamprigera yunnana]|nr:hypothetical protein FQA39_LY02756 [Lamprigera yunnana]
MEADFLNVSDEEYVVHRAKRALKDDAIAAKAWMITAKTLYPNNFAVQFEAYKIEKEAGHVKEAAKYFSDLLGKFQQEPEFWQEIEHVTAALRTEHDAVDSEKHFLCEMFRHISFDVQHQLLLFTADHCEDAMEHCKLLLLLLQKFPTTISTHGPKLVDTLLSAEKHSHASNQPINPYRKLLVCDLLPLLATENVSVEFSSKLLFKLLHKSTEFYLCSLDLSKNNILDPNMNVDDPWKKLFGIVELTGRHLGWESYLATFGKNWTKESYWQKILTFCQTHKAHIGEDHVNSKQLLYCLTIFFLHCLYDYNSSLSPEACPGQLQTSFLLVEGFTDTPSPNPVSEPKSKKRKGDADNVAPFVTVEKTENKNITSNFLMTVNCWEILHSSDYLQREFGKLNNHVKLDSWLSGFLIDYALYKGCYDDALGRLQQIIDPQLQLVKNIRHANILYRRKNYTSSFEPLLLVIQSLPISNKGTLSFHLNSVGSHRHLHFLPITHMAILQYCTKLLIRCIKESLQKESNSYNELSLGNILVLLQLDWPQEEDLLPLIIEQIQQRGAFSYLLFQAYIINIDILEELTYLWTEQGGQITLDILPHLGQRRIGTRGADKGVKEEIKHTIKRQIARSNEPLDQLIIKFISQERGHILQSLISTRRKTQQDIYKPRRIMKSVARPHAKFKKLIDMMTDAANVTASRKEDTSDHSNVDLRVDELNLFPINTGDKMDTVELKLLDQDDFHTLFESIYLHNFFRLSSVFIVQTWFVPDEYWQSLEVAHKLAFDYGYLTWEWKMGIRSYAYPLAIAVLYKILHVLHLDYAFVLIYAPRILQSLLSTYADYCFYSWSGKSQWALFNILTSWFWFYVCSRTLINTLETALTVIALKQFPWISKGQGSSRFLWIVAFLCLFRPTATIQWLPLCIYYVIISRETLLNIIYRKILPISVISVAITTSIDSCAHGTFTISAYEFLKANIFHDVGKWYGTQPWYWYMSAGLPAILGIQIVPFILASINIIRNRHVYQENLALLGCITFSISIYSCLNHKEFRFILPLLPIILKICSEYLAKWSYKAAPFAACLVATAILVSNVIPALYLSIIHQQGTLNVMDPLRKIAEESPQNKSFLFLMPCHSTPLYSHLHQNVTARFLTCEPNLQDTMNYIDEADEFYNNPNSWLKHNYPSSNMLPSHIIAFDTLLVQLTYTLTRYKPVHKVFHTNIPSGRVGQYIFIFERVH